MFGDNFWINNPPIWNNPIHNRCNQLKEYVKKNLCVTHVEVCRCHVGSRLYYNVSFKENTEYGAFEKLFKGISTGLVEFDIPTQHHIYLIDEDELHEKYLNANGDLVFKEPFCLFDLNFEQKYCVLHPIREQLENNCIQVNKVDIWDDYLMLVCKDTDFIEISVALNIDRTMVRVTEESNVYMIKRWDK